MLTGSTEIPSVSKIYTDNLCFPNNFVSDILSNTFEITDQTDLAGYSLVMDPNDQSVQYNYDVLTIDSEENFILITSNDSINVKISLQGLEEESNITFSEISKHLAIAPNAESSESSQEITASTIFK